MSLRSLPACLMASLFLLATWFLVASVEAADDAAELKPGTKVIVDVGGESVGEVIEKVARDVYRVRVKIRTGDVIEPVFPVQRLRLAPADAIVGAPRTEPNVDPAATNPGAAASPTASSGTVTVTPGTVTPGTVTPGTVTPGTVTPGTVTQGKVIVNSGDCHSGYRYAGHGDTRHRHARHDGAGNGYPGDRRARYGHTRYGDLPQDLRARGGTTECRP